MPQSLRQHLLTTLQSLSSAPRYWVAFSGGLDSTVLLHLMASLRGELDAPLLALHVDHALSEHSAGWSRHCRDLCAALDVSLTVEQVSVARDNGKGLEAAARHARYAAFEQVLGEEEVLLCAHHRDDQAETLLLQLMRGGGVHGLAAMPTQRSLGKGLLLRPLLDRSRAELDAYAREHDLTWIDDPSNFDTTLERNYLRHTLLPQLEERRSGMHKVLARSAANFAESAKLLDELAEQDRRVALGEGDILSLSHLRSLTPARCRNLLRFHCRQLDLPLPEARQLQQVVEELLPAAEDAMPLVAWPGVEVRRYRDGVYFMPPLLPLPEEPFVIHWDGRENIALPSALGTVNLLRQRGRGVLAEKLRGNRCELRLRQGGESLALPGRQGHHDLKKLYQEAGVPTWERERRPLLFIGDELAQVSGLWTAEKFAASEKEEGIILHWSLFAIEKEAQNNDN
jgi:tRNA(Ile)-lysidine synthase